VGCACQNAMPVEPGSDSPDAAPCARASNLAPTSTRDKPVPRPAGLAERADLRKAMDSSDAAFRASKREAADREMGMKAGGKVKKMAMRAASAVVWALPLAAETSAGADR
jgi:hypothetical protein